MKEENWMCVKELTFFIDFQIVFPLTGHIFYKVPMKPACNVRICALLLTDKIKQMLKLNIARLPLDNLFNLSFSSGTLGGSCRSSFICVHGTFVPNFI